MNNSNHLFESVEDIVNIFINNHKKVSRLDTLKAILDSSHINYIVQNNKHATNILVTLGDHTDKKITVLGAHYDVYPGSIGINDNTVAVAMLIKLAQALSSKTITNRLDIVFFDREEDGMYGSSLYINELYNEFADDTHIIDHAFIYDVIGYGDTIIAVNKNKQVPQSYALDRLVNFAILNHNLVSDNVIFEAHGVPTTLTVVAPQTDLIATPTGVIMKPSTMFYQSFHNRKLDNKLELINYPLVNMMYYKLLEEYSE